MNALLNKIIENRGANYCHAVEVSSVHELENMTEAIINENENEFSIEVITEFLETLAVYYLAEEEEENLEEEEKIYNFSFYNYINENLI